MISMPAFVCLLMIVYMPNRHTLIVQDNDKRTKNRGRFNICISAKRRPNYIAESLINKSTSVVWIEKRDKRTKKSHST